MHLLVLTVALACADVSIGQPRSLPLHALRGPYASPEAWCADPRRDREAERACVVVRRTAQTAALVVTYGGGQRGVMLAVEHEGWWIDEETGLFDSNRGRGSFVVLGVADRGARLIGVQAHWHKSIDDGHDVYYCFEVEVRCADVRCTDALPIAGRRDCGLGVADEVADFDATRWDWQQQVREIGGELDIRRLAWRDFPTRFGGYSDWMRDTAARARALAGRWRWPG